jgi:pseudaminic acid synthase
VLTDRPIVVAEISANHRGSQTMALGLIQEAKRAGADAVKIQVWHPDHMAAPGYIMEGGPWAGRDLAKIYQEAHLPWAWLPEMFAEAKRQRIVLFASVFDNPSLRRLEALDCPIYKIASFELVDLPLIAAASSTRKPIILSAGMAAYDEVQKAVETARGAGAKDITLLKCTSAYPASHATMNMWAMPELGKQFGTKFGLSDHSLGNVAPVIATALGADIIEKHFCLTKEGLDGAFSLDPQEFGSMVEAVRQTSEAMGTPFLHPARAEEPMRALRRSLHYVRDLPAGHVLTMEDTRSMRPSGGLHPNEQLTTVGRALTKSVKTGDPVSWQDVTPQE